MLRSGQFDKALTLYESVREPLRSRSASRSIAFLATTTDPAVYYDKLTSRCADGDRASKLPPLVIEWAREEAEDERVFAVIDDVTPLARSDQEARASWSCKLNAVLASPTRVKAFPELEGGARDSTSVC